jgi:hypothetical protein
MTEIKCSPEAYEVLKTLQIESIDTASGDWCKCPITLKAAYDIDENIVVAQIADGAIEFINTGKIYDFPMLEFTITVKEH